MNENERKNRLKQVDIDLAALEEEKKKLKEPKHQFKAGDVVIYGVYGEGAKKSRIITPELKAINASSWDNGRSYTHAKGQSDFEMFNYKYIGRVSDFINEKTIEAFQRNGEVL